MPRRPAIRSTRDYDTTGLRVGASGAHVGAAWPQWVTIQFLYRDKGATFGVAIRRSKAAIQRNSTLLYGVGALRHVRQRARQGLSHDTIFVS